MSGGRTGDVEGGFDGVRPLYRTTDLFRCPRLHDRQFPASVTRYGGRGDGEEQIFPRLALDPDEQLVLIRVTRFWTSDS